VQYFSTKVRLYHNYLYYLSSVSFVMYFVTYTKTVTLW